MYNHENKPETDTHYSIHTSLGTYPIKRYSSQKRHIKTQIFSQNYPDKERLMYRHTLTQLQRNKEVQ